MAAGSLRVVGTGIKAIGHWTYDARFWIQRAEKVLFLVNDAVSESEILALSPSAESLGGLYREGIPRSEIYASMVERILDAVRSGLRVCAVFYGHPGVFVQPSHEAVRRARAEGFEAEMLPGISAEDCLVADLGVDPARVGLQSYEATDFLVRRRKVDPSAALILWQIAAVGILDYKAPGVDLRHLPVLIEALLAHYPADHVAVVYQAAVLPTSAPHVERIPLADLAKARITSASTLYVPPLAVPSPDPAMLARLGLRPSA